MVNQLKVYCENIFKVVVSLETRTIYIYICRIRISNPDITNSNWKF